MERYLNPKKYYEDTYDRQTVDFCCETESIHNESIKDRIEKKTTEKDRASLAAHRLIIYFETGERYLYKEDTIKEWMNRDKAKDELLENAIPPNDIYCNKCGEAMFVKLKTLHSEISKEEDRVLFLFRCPSKCQRGRLVFDNGEERVVEPDLCGKCGIELNERDERKGEIITTYYNCPECGFKKTERLDLSVKEKKEKIDKLFNRDRARFCLTSEKGQKYYDGKIGIKQLKKTIEDIEERKKNKKVYEKVSKLKKLTIVELEKLLTSALKKENYIKLELGKPEMGRDVFVELSIRDGKSGREEYDSKANLKKAIKKTLEGTNWRLMSSGVSYRLGFLTGKLRGYEREEDLVKLANFN
jgi:DNA-directed RNA polymerase subunit RPC12/RpoP